MQFSILVRHSRPRFRHYLFGPMLVLGAVMLRMNLSVPFSSDVWLSYLALLCFTLFFGNIFVYGINDYYDDDTDKFNTKKQGYEQRLQDKKNVLLYIVGAQLVFVVLYAVIAEIGFAEIGYSLAIRLGAFYLFSRIYSAPPLRAKARPFLDGITNVLYICIPVFFFSWLQSMPDGVVFSWAYFPRRACIAARAWCIAMHCFSAIPDIEADSKAGISTTAVYLGKEKSLLYCIVRYMLAGILAYPLIGWISLVFAVMYAGLVAAAYRRDIFMIYKRFPRINVVVGMCLCFWIFFYDKY